MFILASQARSQLVPDLPSQLSIDVTNHCNSSCASCPRTYDHFLPCEARKHLSWADFRPSVDQFLHLERAFLPCCISPFATQEYSRLILGNVLCRSAIQVWNNTPYQELLAAVLSNIPDP